MTEKQLDALVISKVTLLVRKETGATHSKIQPANHALNLKTKPLNNLMAITLKIYFRVHYGTENRK